MSSNMPFPAEGDVVRKPKKTNPKPAASGEGRGCCFAPDVSPSQKLVVAESLSKSRARGDEAIPWAMFQEASCASWIMAVLSKNEPALGSFDDFLQMKFNELRMSILSELLIRNSQPKQDASSQTPAEEKRHVEKNVAFVQDGECVHKVNGPPKCGADETCAVAHDSPLAAEAKPVDAALEFEKSKSILEVPASRTSSSVAVGSGIWEHMNLKHVWEVSMTLVIVSHFLCMGVQIQLMGMDTGEYLDFGGGGHVEHPESVEKGFAAVEMFYTLIYTADLVVQIVSQRWSWLYCSWNWIDLLVVVGTYIDLIFSNLIAISPSTFKVFRLAKLQRAVRVMKSFDLFEACILLLRSLQKSLGALFWSACVICTFIITSGLIMSQCLAVYFEDDSFELEKRQAVYELFGTFSRSVLTMFEFTLGNWGPPTWVLVNNVNPTLMLVCIAYKITVGFAVLNVINAVFLKQTMKCSEEIDDFTIQQKKKAQDSYMQRLSELFEEMDESGDGSVSFDEFQNLMACPAIIAWLELLEISTKDSTELFNTLDGGDGSITVDEWIKGISRIKGDATAVDAMTLLASISRVEGDVRALRDILDTDYHNKHHSGHHKDGHHAEGKRPNKTT